MPNEFKLNLIAGLVVIGIATVCFTIASIFFGPVVWTYHA